MNDTPMRTPAKPSTAIRLDPGQEIHGFRVVSEIGLGGMSRVYRVEQNGVPYALKIPLTDPTGMEPDEWRDMLIRVDREAGLALQLEHANILKPLGKWVYPNPVEGVPVLLLPLVSGLTLREYVRVKRPTLRFFLEHVVRPLADALAYAHRRSVVHRDIKPGNILVRDEDNHPLLIDWGIARSGSVATATVFGTAKGTPQYFAPEQIAYWTGKDGRLNNRQRMAEAPQHDLYSFGVSLYEVLAGGNPFTQFQRGEDATFGFFRFLEDVNKYEVPALSQVNSGIPPEVAAFVGNVMAKDPAARFKTAEDLICALDELLNVPGLSLDAQISLPASKSSSQRAVPGPVPTAGARGQPSAASVAEDSAILADSLIIDVSQEPESSERRPAPGEFRAPTAASKAASYASPASVVVEAPVPAKASDGLPSMLLKAKARLDAPAEATTRRNALILGGALLVVMVVLVLAVGVQPRNEVVQPHSLLAEHGADAGAAVRFAVRPALLSVPPSLPSVPDAGPNLLAESDRARKGRSAGADGKAVDELIAREYGGVRPVIAAVPAEVNAKANSPSWVSEATSLNPRKKDGESAAFGIPMGAEIPVRLMKPLDSRTVSGGPVVARLHRPYVARGNILLPSGTMLYGAAMGTPAGRFDVRFNRLRLPNNREVPFQALAYDNDDRKPGLRASSRTMQSGAAGGSGLGEKVVKGTANLVLGKVTGDDAADVARTVGQTVVNHSDTSAGGGSMEVLLLEAPADFTVFVSESF